MCLFQRKASSKSTLRMVLRIPNSSILPNCLIIPVAVSPKFHSPYPKVMTAKTWSKLLKSQYFTIKMAKPNPLTRRPSMSICMDQSTSTMSSTNLSNSMVTAPWTKLRLMLFVTSSSKWKKLACWSTAPNKTRARLSFWMLTIRLPKIARILISQQARPILNSYNSFTSGRLREEMMLLRKSWNWPANWVEPTWTLKSTFRNQFKFYRPKISMNSLKIPGLPQIKGTQSTITWTTTREKRWRNTWTSSPSVNPIRLKLRA